MASSCSTGGRGRGRGRASTRKIDEIPSPSIITPSPSVITSSPSIVTPSSEHDSAVSDDNSSSKSQPVLPIGGSRGRGFRRKQKQMVPSDPHHLDSTLTVDTLQPSIQSIKSAESGTIGDPIEVMVNYFAIVQYPKQGLVYQYYIEIKNACGRLIQRNRRR
ncbi:unnamed protein product [Rotaria sordida]|uniref:Uncharacterized protein n=1 Tax=Rotaria sordida TaxID=392033 RepID=A0A820EK49_9BILA|nr:unnamed protein product [Rotaria sordida]CAF4078453.1 unnamed protein product [Rotaria sordida]CAF4249976.1 unnamed protein product [Rotaria sordida]